MTGSNAVQGIVIVFAVIFLGLLIVMVRNFKKRSDRELSDHFPQGQGEVLEPSTEKESSSLSVQKTMDKVDTVHRVHTVDKVDKVDTVHRVHTVDKVDKDLNSDEPRASDQSVAAKESIPEEAELRSQEEAIATLEKEGPSLEAALVGTKQRFWGRIQALWSGSNIASIDEIEEVLYTSDLGPQTVERLLENIRESLSRSEKKDPETVREALRGEIAQIFAKNQSLEEPAGLFEQFQFHQPTVWMVVGVNGAGKTTSIGKIASQLASHGKKVLVAAGDTFRAAAGNQLKVWTDRAQVEIFAPEGVKDPSAVAFDAVQKGVAKNYDVIIVDTAGRLHTQHNLMEEIKKMKRVVQKVIPEAPHEVLLVLDSNQGQNALLQAKEFHKALGITGVVLTKLDGTAKGGVAVGVANELELPIKLIGVGEKMSDLRPFSVRHFVESIL